MKRKVSRIGPSTLMISLPSKWIKKNNIQKGDELEIEIKEKKLVIRTETRREIEKTTVDVSNFQGLILRCLAAIYKRGYDEVELTFDKKELLSEIHDSLKNEISDFEIVAQGKSYCRIKSIAEGIEGQFDVILRRTLILLNTMAEDACEAIKKNDFSRLKNTAYLEETNNRFTTFCRRILNKYGYKDSKNVTFIYYLVEELENIADQYKYLCNYFYDKRNSKHAVKIRKEVVAGLEQVTLLLREFYEFFYKFDKEKVLGFSLRRKKLIKNSLEMIDSKKLNREEIMLLHYTITLTQQIFQLMGPYLAMEL